MPKRSRSGSPPSQGKEKGDLEIEITTPEDFRNQQAGNSSPTAEKSPRPKKPKTEEPDGYDLRPKREHPKDRKRWSGQGLLDNQAEPSEKPRQGVVGQEPTDQKRTIDFASAAAEEGQEVLESRQRDKVDSTGAADMSNQSIAPKGLSQFLEGDVSIHQLQPGSSSSESKSRADGEFPLHWHWYKPLPDIVTGEVNAINDVDVDAKGYKASFWDKSMTWSDSKEFERKAWNHADK